MMQNYCLQMFTDTSSLVYEINGKDVYVNKKLWHEEYNLMF